jgi:uncharacterized membrane protein
MTLGPVHAALAGAATGSRSLTGLAALILATPGDAKRQPDRALGRPWVKAVAGLAATGEISADKLPSAPSRLNVPGLGSRLAGAAAAGVIIARRAPGDGSSDPRPAQLAGCVAASVGAAVATAWLGTRWRTWAASRFGHDWIGAVMEDATAVTLATAAARPASVPPREASA